MQSRSVFHNLSEQSLGRTGRLYISVFLVMVGYIVLMLALGHGGVRLFAPSVIAVLSCVAFGLHRLARDVWAMSVFIWGAWLAVTAQGFVVNGVGNAALFAYPAMFLLGGWVLGVRQGLLLALASVVGSFALAYAEHMGWIVGRIPIAPLLYWTPLAIVMVASMIAMRYILKAHWDGVEGMLVLNAELESANKQLSAREIALQRSEMEIKELNEALETRVAQRTSELTEALETLRRAQDELVQSEKLASLGQLVAGVAHELNTPIGNALVTTTALGYAANEFEVQLREGNIKKSTLEQFVLQISEGATLAERSLHRASELVRSFKQVAVDQASERKRVFDLAHSVAEVVDTLRPNLKGRPWEIDFDIPANIQMDSYPGPLGQVVINLVMNAVLHGFEGRTSGTIRIRAQQLGPLSVTLTVADDGVGIASDNLPRIFDPFFTTKLGKGGSGLGLSIVHRLVTQVLGGQVKVESTVGQGTLFTLELPLFSPEIGT